MFFVDNEDKGCDGGGGGDGDDCEGIFMWVGGGVGGDSCVGIVVVGCVEMDVGSAHVGEGLGAGFYVESGEVAGVSVGGEIEAGTRDAGEGDRCRLPEEI